MNRNASIVMLLVAALGASAFAVGFLGTPTAELNKGQWGIGGEYGYSSQDLDKTKIKYRWTDFDEDGAVVDSDSGTYKIKIKDLNINRYYGVLSYGVTEDWQVSVRLGLTDVKARFEDAEDSTDKWSVNFDNDFAWGLATKYTFLRQEKIDWGVSAQMNWATMSYDEKGMDAGLPWKASTDIDAFELLVAVGPTIDMGGWKLYGGGFYYYLDAKQDAKGTDVFDDDDAIITETWKESSDLEADGNFGAFIGAQVDLTSNIAWTSEVSAKQNGWGLGTGIMFKF